MRIHALFLAAMAAAAMASGPSQAADRRPDPNPDEPAAGIRLEAIYNVVYAVQERLGSLGYQPGGADGVWGPNTRNAVNAYRRDNDLWAGTGLDWDVIEAMFGRDYIQWKIDDRAASEGPTPPEAVSTL